MVFGGEKVGAGKGVSRIEFALYFWRLKNRWKLSFVGEFRFSSFANDRERCVSDETKKVIYKKLSRTFIAISEKIFQDCTPDMTLFTIPIYAATECTKKSRRQLILLFVISRELGIHSNLKHREKIYSHISFIRRIAVGCVSGSVPWILETEVTRNIHLNNLSQSICNFFKNAGTWVKNSERLK